MSAKFCASRWLGGLTALLCLCAQAAGVRAQNAERELRRDQLFIADNSFAGPTGGIRVVDAASGPSGTFRLAFTNELMWKSDFISSGDEVRHYAGNFSLSVTPIEHLEVFGSFEVSSDQNEREQTQLLAQVADVLVGAKGYHWFRPWLAVGGDASLALTGGLGDTKAALKSTSVGLRGSVTLDFRTFERRELPLVTRFGAQYWFDNSANAAEPLEDERRDALTDALSPPLETRQLLTPFERFAYGINRVDTVRLGIGAEAPLRVGRVGLHPLLEWRWDLPVNRQDFQCVYDGDSESPAAEGCLAQQKAKAFPMTLTAGLRVLPPVRGLSIRLGVDVGVTGSRVFVRELAPTAPYNIILGASYAFDPGRADRRAALAPSVPEPADPIATSDSVTEQGESDGDAADAPEAGRSEATSGARLELALIGKGGAKLAGVRVGLTGPVDREVVSNAQGQAIFESLPAGVYRLWVLDPAYLRVSTELRVTAEASHHSSLRALPRPAQSSVQVSGNRLRLRTAIRFASGSSEILPASDLLLAEVADLLLTQPGLLHVRVEGHTDNIGQPTRNLALSQRRAEAVRARLVTHGVEPSRLTAQGYGSAHPLLPNITQQNRSRNRRVQLSIERRAALGAVARP